MSERLLVGKQQDICTIASNTITTRMLCVFAFERNNLERAVPYLAPRSADKPTGHLFQPYLTLQGLANNQTDIMEGK